MEETENRTPIALALIFNETGQVLTVDGRSLPHASGHDAIEAMRKSIAESFNTNVGFGDSVYDDYSPAGSRVIVLLTFLENYDNVDGTMWCDFGDVEHEEADLIPTLRTHLTNTLFNANKMQMGNCYENIKTGEAYYVIHVINDTMRQKNFLVMESTMCEEPFVLPADAFWGVPVRWIPHLQFMKCVQNVPDTLAERAKYFFINAHNMTNHRYEGKPYSYHLSMVIDEFHKYKHLIPAEDHDRVEAELWGHDGIEDARLTRNDIESEFNDEVAEGCYSLTNEKGRNRSERANDKYYAGLAKDVYGEFKKLCDRLANVRHSVSSGHSMGNGYRKELPRFKAKLNTHGDVYSIMWMELESLLS